jgi:hypothetical protein
MPHVKRRANMFLILMGMGLFALIVVFILILTIPARASTSPDNGLPGFTCELVREKVAEHGKAVALAWALKQGYTFAQIRLARRCLK